MGWRKQRGALERARLGLAACLFACLIPALPGPRAADSSTGPSCEPSGAAREKPIPFPKLKRSLSRGTEVRIVDFGPPFLKGLGDGAPELSYGPRLQRLLRKSLLHSHIMVETQGAAGETAAAALSRIKAEIAGEPPAFAIWRTGADDILQKTPLDRFEASLRQGIALLRGADVEMEIIGLPMTANLAADAQYGAIARALAAIAREQGIAYVDRGQVTRAIVMAQGGEDRASDGAWTIDDFGYGCLAEQAARPIIEGVRATR